MIQAVLFFRERSAHWRLGVLSFTLLSLFAVISQTAVAEEASPQSEEPKKLNLDAPKEVNSNNRDSNVTRRITVVGSKEGQAETPGSVYYMDKEELSKALIGTDDVHRVLRRVPGVNVTEEDGFGLRPNIGFRGVSTERSSSITLMEDGVLTAPAPYTAPAAYFFPTVGRMESLEVLKGASIIKYGPYTTGGSLNLLTPRIPNDLRSLARIEFGENDARKVHAHVGGSFDNGGVFVQTYQASNDGFKVLDGGGDTGFDLSDYIAKFRLNTSPEAEFYQHLELKMNYYDQDSNETYVGLTPGDFDANPYRRYVGTQLDNIQVDRKAFTLTHYAEFSEAVDLTTVGYYNTTSRNWFKLERAGAASTSSIFSSPDEYSEELGWIRGTNSPVDALAVRNNVRNYEAIGVQSTLGVDFETGSLNHAVEFSARFHSDEEDRLQDEDLFQMFNQSMVLTTDGAVGTNANRISSADAWAFYLGDKITWSDFTFTPGVRYEYIDFTREDFGKTDPTRLGTERTIAENSVNGLIPGVGVQYDFTEEFAVFFGLHKGFSPPGATGTSDIQEEESINYEWGAKYREDAFASDLVLFYTDYDNLLGADTVASGGEGTGDLFNGGAASVFGIEAIARYDFSDALNIESLGLPAYVSYTYTDAEFDSSFDSEFFGLVTSGDAIPYIAENQIGIGVGLEHTSFSLGLDARYEDGMPTVAGQSGTVSTDKTDDFFIVDLQGKVPVADGVSLVGSVLNLLDEEYVAARRPAGARPGVPRLFFAGIEFKLG